MPVEHVRLLSLWDAKHLLLLSYGMTRLVPGSVENIMQRSVCGQPEMVVMHSWTSLLPAACLYRWASR